jgi:hypothetical protein
LTRVRADDEGHAPPSDTPLAALIDYYAALTRSELGRCIQNAHARGDKALAEAISLKERAFDLGKKDSSDD